MSSNNTVFLNASEHLFGLGISETLMLRNYSHLNNLLFCSMMGGSESIRDLQEARNLGVDAYEFPLVESFFSMEKIFLALEKVFSENIKLLSNQTIFIDIASIDGLNIVSNIRQLELPTFLSNSNIVFNFNRRLLVKSCNQLTTNSYEVSDYEMEINNTILDITNNLSKLRYPWSISGGIREESLLQLNDLNLKPNFIKTGMFTLSTTDTPLAILSKRILNFQSIEAKLLNLMNNSLHFKNNYLNQRQMHMMNYIIDSLV